MVCSKANYSGIWVYTFTVYIDPNYNKDEYLKVLRNLVWDIKTIQKFDPCCKIIVAGDFNAKAMKETDVLCDLGLMRVIPMNQATHNRN